MKLVNLPVTWSARGIDRAVETPAYHRSRVQRTRQAWRNASEIAAKALSASQTPRCRLRKSVTRTEGADGAADALHSGRAVGRRAGRRRVADRELRRTECQRRGDCDQGADRCQTTSASSSPTRRRTRTATRGFGRRRPASPPSPRRSSASTHSPTQRMPPELHPGAFGSGATFVIATLSRAGRKCVGRLFSSGVS